MNTRTVSHAVGAVGAVLAFMATCAFAQTPSAQCDRPPVEPCAVRHGRLTSRQGIPYGIWLIGTTRMIKVQNDPDSFLPADTTRYLEVTSADHGEVFGDFAICPREPDQPRHMRLACVTSAKNLIVRPLDGRPPFRVRSTWSSSRSRRKPR